MQIVRGSNTRQSVRVPGSISRKDQSRLQLRRNLQRRLNYSQDKETFLASSAARLTANRSCGGPFMESQHLFFRPRSVSNPLPTPPPTVTGDCGYLGSVTLRKV